MNKNIFYRKTFLSTSKTDIVISLPTLYGGAIPIFIGTAVPEPAEGGLRTNEFTKSQFKILLNIANSVDTNRLIYNQ